MILTDSQPDAYTKFQQDFEQICEKMKEKIAITYYQKNGNITEISYGELRKAVDKCVEVYKMRGFSRGDRVAVIEPLCADAYIVLLTFAYMGVTAVVLDVNLPAPEIHRLLEDADVSAIITTEEINRNKITDTCIAVFSADVDCKIINDAEINHPIDPDFEAIAILYSSGTTSKAKGVVIGYEQEINAMDYLLEVVGTTDIRYLMLFPNSHVSGFTDFLVLLLRGGQLATMEDASATQLMQGFQLYKPNTFGMVPKVWETFKCKIEDGIREKGKRQARTIFGLIAFCGGLRKLTGINLGRKLFHSINEQVFGGNLISVHSGGGKSNPEVMRFFWNLGYDCFDFYASTEANIPILVTDGKKYMDSVGRVDANPNAKIRVWNPDENGIGEIQVKSNTMMLGYFRNPELTKEAFEGEYFKTGDYGRIVKNEVYITGRIKESIHLRNGEKVSPDDVEEMYKQYLPTDLEYAVVGIPDGDSYDRIAVFVVAQSGAYDSVFAQINKSVAMNYQYKKLEYLDELPKTSVGKVKRIALRKKYTKSLLKDEKKKTSQNVVYTHIDEIENTALDNPKEALEKLLSRFSEKDTISPNDKIKDDLGIDSLGIFEMCIEFEKLFEVNIQNQLQENSTVQELLVMIQNKQEDDLGDHVDGIDKYPVKRRKSDWRRLDRFIRWMRKVYDFSVEGLERIDFEENYIFAPNHESHFDGMLMVSTMPRRMQDRICSMAANYLFEDRFLKPGTVIMGGVPVDRTGNPTRATKRIYDLLNSGNYSLLIHPEGTRTRSGQMGHFKSGAAELSKKTGIKIVPVAVSGAWDVFPPDRKLPKFGKNEQGQKYPIIVKFGVPMNPEDYENADTMTQELYDAVVRMKH